MFEKLSEILNSLSVDGAVIGSAAIEVTLKRGGRSVAHIDLRSEADGETKIISAMVDEGYYKAVEAKLAEHQPEHQRVYDFSNVASGGWSSD